MDEGVRPGRSVFAEEGLDDGVDGDDSLPHWTAAPTGATRAVEPGDSWSTITGAEPRWRDDTVAADDEVEFQFVDDDPPGHDFFAYDDREPARAAAPQDDLDGSAVVPLESRRGGSGRGADAGARARPAVGASGMPKRDDMLLRVATGVALGVAALVTFRIGPRAAIVLIALVLGLAVAEFFAATRRAGYQPAALLGIAATAALPLAIYWRGLDALPLVLFLTVAFSLVWFLIGVGNESPLLNVGVTVMGVVYVGVLGSFAALMLSLWGDDGIGILLGGVVATVAYDVGGLVVGRVAGRSHSAPQARTRLSRASSAAWRCASWHRRSSCRCGNRGALGSTVSSWASARRSRPPSAICASRY